MPEYYHVAKFKAGPKADPSWSTLEAIRGDTTDAAKFGENGEIVFVFLRDTSDEGKEDDFLHTLQETCAAHGYEQIPYTLDEYIGRQFLIDGEVYTAQSMYSAVYEPFYLECYSSKLHWHEYLRNWYGPWVNTNPAWWKAAEPGQVELLPVEREEDEGKTQRNSIDSGH